MNSGIVARIVADSQRYAPHTETDAAHTQQTNTHKERGKGRKTGRAVRGS